MRGNFKRRFAKRKAAIDSLPVLKLIPNLLTLVSLIVGLSSVRFSLSNRWEEAVSCIMLAAFIDGIDGKVARILNATSKFGAELDSLCDFANFGVFPMFINFLWAKSQHNSSILWVSASLYVICMAIRLARFNVDCINNTDAQNTNISSNQKSHFVGVPAPIGAMLALTPMMMEFELCKTISSSYGLLPAYLLCISFLLPSRIKTLSIKNLQVNKRHLWIMMIAFSLCAALILLFPWHFLPILACIYLVTIPFWHYKINARSIPLSPTQVATPKK